MSSGLADAAVLAPLKPVSMSGDPHEDTPVFEDIKTPSRALENPPDLAQVRAGTGPFLPLRCAEPPENLRIWAHFCFVIFLVFAATPPWLCRLPLPPLLGFLLGVLSFVWEFWFGLFFGFFFFASCVPSNLPGGLCSHPGLNPCALAMAGQGVSRASPTGKDFGIWIVWWTENGTLFSILFRSLYFSATTAGKECSSRFPGSIPPR